MRKNTSPPSVVKMNIEGEEIPTLQGMSRILQGHSPELFLEVHPTALDNRRSSSEAVMEILQDVKYAIEWIRNSGTMIMRLN